MNIRSLCIATALAISAIAIPYILFSAPIVHAATMFDFNAPVLSADAGSFLHQLVPFAAIAAVFVAFVKSPTMLAVLFLVAFMLTKSLFGNSREFSADGPSLYRRRSLGWRRR